MESFLDSNTNQQRIAIAEAPSTDLADMVEDNDQINIRQCCATDFVQGFMLIIALHYIFNISYSKDIEAPMIFF